MCHSDSSRPPVAPGAVPAASDRPLELRSGDGTRVLAHEARAQAPRGVGVVVLPDVRGLHEYYRQLAVRFAESGVETVAVDWFGRTAPDDDRSEDFAPMPHVQQLTHEGVAADVAAAVEHLRGQGVTSVFTVGFCLGGGYSWRQAADTPGLAGCGRLLRAAEPGRGRRRPAAGAAAHARRRRGRAHPGRRHRGARRGCPRTGARRARRLRGGAALVLRPVLRRARAGLRAAWERIQAFLAEHG